MAILRPGLSMRRRCAATSLCQEAENTSGRKNVKTLRLHASDFHSSPWSPKPFHWLRSGDPEFVWRPQIKPPGSNGASPNFTSVLLNTRGFPSPDTTNGTGIYAAIYKAPSKHLNCSASRVWVEFTSIHESDPFLRSGTDLRNFLDVDWSYKNMTRLRRKRRFTRFGPGSDWTCSSIRDRSPVCFDRLRPQGPRSNPRSHEKRPPAGLGCWYPESLRLFLKVI